MISEKKKEMEDRRQQLATETKRGDRRTLLSKINKCTGSARGLASSVMHSVASAYLNNKSPCQKIQSVLLITPHDNPESNPKCNPGFNEGKNTPPIQATKSGKKKTLTITTTKERPRAKIKELALRLQQELLAKKAQIRPVTIETKDENKSISIKTPLLSDKPLELLISFQFVLILDTDFEAHSNSHEDFDPSPIVGIRGVAVQGTIPVHLIASHLRRSYGEGGDPGTALKLVLLNKIIEHDIGDLAQVNDMIWRGEKHRT